MSEESSMGPRNGERLPGASTADEETPAVGAAEQQATPVNAELPVDGVGSPQVAVDEMVRMETTASSEGSADVFPGVEQAPHIDVERPATDDKIAAFLHGHPNRRHTTRSLQAGQPLRTTGGISHRLAGNRPRNAGPD